MTKRMLLAAVALMGACGGPMDASEQQQANLLVPIGGGGTTSGTGGTIIHWPLPPLFPDYGLPGPTGGCASLPSWTDYEGWDKKSDLWKGRWGYVMPYYTYTDSTHKTVNYTRLELIGIDGETDAVDWHMFAPFDTTVEGGVPQPIWNLPGTDNPMCSVHLGQGGLSSGKPPVPPPPPDNLAGGSYLFCPVLKVQSDLADRIKGCYDVVQ
jgi:hypothetical protein